MQYLGILTLKKIFIIYLKFQFKLSFVVLLSDSGRRSCCQERLVNGTPGAPVLVFLPWEPALWRKEQTCQPRMLNPVPKPPLHRHVPHWNPVCLVRSSGDHCLEGPGMPRSHLVPCRIQSKPRLGVGVLGVSSIASGHSLSKLSVLICKRGSIISSVTMLPSIVRNK